MKKTLLYAAAAFLTLAASCQQAELAPEKVTPAGDNTLVCKIQDFATTKATIGSIDEDAFTLQWQEGDEILVFDENWYGGLYGYGEDINFIKFYKQSGASKGSFVLAVDQALEIKGKPGYVADPDLLEVDFLPLDYRVAYSPYIHYGDGNRSTNISMNSDYVISGVNLPATQSYVKDNIAQGIFPMVAVSALDAKEMIFNHVLGGLLFNITGPETIRSITIEGVNEEPLAGDVTLEVESDGTIELAGATGTSVTLDCGDAGVKLDETEPTRFIILLPPTEFSKGLKVTVTDINGLSKTATNSKANTVVASNFLSFDLRYENDLVFQLTNETVSTQYLPAKGGEGIKLGVQTNMTEGEGGWTLDRESLPDWITALETKASAIEDFYISVDEYVDENNTLSAREAILTFEYGGQELSYKVIQKPYFPTLIAEDQTWDESFGYHTSKNSSNPKQSTTSKEIKIALSDDPAKGTYLISNMFGLPPYDGAEAQGLFYGSFYADLTGNKLTVYAANNTHEKLASRWGNDIVLTWDPEAKTLSGPSVTEVTYTSQDWYFFNYTATVHEDKPAGGDEPSGNDPFIGTWSSTYAKSSGGELVTADFVIEASDNNSYDYKITALADLTDLTNAYLTYDEANNVLILSKDAKAQGEWGPQNIYYNTKPEADDIQFVVNADKTEISLTALGNNNISGQLKTNFSVYDFTATKPTTDGGGQ